MYNPILELALPWKPQVKERPRFGNGRAYTSKNTLAAEASLREQFKELAPDWEPYDNTCHVQWTFTNSHVGVVLLPHDDYEARQLRGDLDNYVKLASDALNGILFKDDRLIVRSESLKL